MTFSFAQHYLVDILLEEVSTIPQTSCSWQKVIQEPSHQSVLQIELVFVSMDKCAVQVGGKPRDYNCELTT
jgi:hypothetical protein